MAANTTPIFPLTPIVGIATLTTATAVTSRANITGTTGLTALTATSTNGTRVDAITVKSKATSVASQVSIWIYNGTTSFLFDEINVVVVTAGNTADSFTLTRRYNNLVLPATYQLYISESVQTDLTVFAFGGQY
jgi:hypothetical protein